MIVLDYATSVAVGATGSEDTWSRTPQHDAPNAGGLEAAVTTPWLEDASHVVMCFAMGFMLISSLGERADRPGIGKTLGSEGEAMSTKSTCDNPMCSCDPCACEGDACACGLAWLGDLERRMIDVLWEKPGDELTGRDVANLLPGYAYTTVATVLDRLVHKKLVRRRMDGRTIRFAATGTGATHTATLMRETLGTTRDPDAALVRFAQRVSPSEADVLRRALNDLGTK